MVTGYDVLNWMASGNTVGGHIVMGILLGYLQRYWGYRSHGTGHANTDHTVIMVVLGMCRDFAVYEG